MFRILVLSSSSSLSLPMPNSPVVQRLVSQACTHAWFAWYGNESVVI
jgi:hypothetical protein